MAEDIGAQIGALIGPMLGRKLFAVLAEPTGTPEQDFPLLVDHLKYFIALEQRGELFAAGPFVEGGQPGQHSLVIVRAESVEAAEALMAEEPLHKAGLRTSTIHEWSLNEGRVSVSIDFSTQYAGLDSAPKHP